MYFAPYNNIFSKSLRCLIAVLLFIAGSNSRIKAQDGLNTYQFLNIPLSTRIYGLGGVNITLVDDDVTTIDQNPALLGNEMDNQVSLSYMRYIGDNNFAGVRYAKAAGDQGAWSAAIQYFGYGEMKETDETGSQIGTFTAKDAAFMVAYSHDITERLRGGINIKACYSAYADYSAFALATDLGINYFDPERDLSLSAVVSNLGGQIKRFNETYDRLPIDVRLGWSQSFGTLPLRFSITAWNLTKWHLPYYHHGDGSNTSILEIKDTFSSNLFRHLVFGVDLISSKNWYLGLGYNYKTRTDMQTYWRSTLSGFSLSGGIKVSNFGIGVALSQPHSGTTTLMLNINASLGGLM